MSICEKNLFLFSNDLQKSFILFVKREVCSYIPSFTVLIATAGSFFVKELKVFSNFHFFLKLMGMTDDGVGVESKRQETNVR